MSATPEIKLEDTLYCVHGRPITIPCLDCEQMMREWYPELYSEDKESVQ